MILSSLRYLTLSYFKNWVTAFMVATKPFARRDADIVEIAPANQPVYRLMVHPTTLKYFNKRKTGNISMCMLAHAMCKSVQPQLRTYTCPAQHDACEIEHNVSPRKGGCKGVHTLWLRCLHSAPLNLTTCAICRRPMIPVWPMHDKFFNWH